MMSYVRELLFYTFVYIPMAPNVKYFILHEATHAQNVGPSWFSGLDWSPPVLAS